jgi:hypothetical protein
MHNLLFNMSFHLVTGFGKSDKNFQQFRWCPTYGARGPSG